MLLMFLDNTSTSTLLKLDFSAKAFDSKFIFLLCQYLAVAALCMVLTRSEQTKTVLSHPSLINNYFTSHILGSSPNQGLFAAGVCVHGGERK